MLPNYKNEQEPLYNNLFEVTLISENFFISQISDIKFENTLQQDIIYVKSVILLKDIENLNFSDFLKDIRYVTHIIYDKTGQIQSQFLINVEFIKIEINFSYNDSNLLNFNLELHNRGSQKIYECIDDLYIKRLQRHYKLDKLI
jgi:hypothetical protein